MIKQSSKQRTFFDPDTISTEIHQALERDFMEAQHVYCLNDSTTLYAFNRQVSELRKKYCPVKQDKERLEAETFSKFLDINSHMGRINKELKKSIPYETSRIQRSTPRMDKIHLRARALMHFVLHDFSVDEWFDECRNSSGASMGVSYKDTSIDAKFTYPMSVTKRAKPYFEHYLRYNNQLSRAIESFNSQYPVRDKYSFEEGSRATTVDKTADKRRMICVEPTCNMFLQQGLMHMMYKRMKAVGLDVETLPTTHQELAKLNSITGLNATIDWTSASDCASIVLLKWLLPPKWYDVVDTVRCPISLIQEEKVHLNMVSTMGNAVTFPLETLIFWTYAHATILTENEHTNSLHPEWWKEKVSVFGDDCIVSSNIATKFISTMEEVGFIVNREKSHYDGPLRFRESCGGDYLAGYDVRPFHLKAPRSTRRSSLEPWLYIITNALLKKYISYFGELSYVYDKELWRVIFGLFRRYKLSIKLVPSFFPDDAGLKLSYDILRFHSHYPIKLNRIAVSQHGSVSFNYLRFSYRKERKRDDGIMLCNWLQKPVQSITPPIHASPLRKIGGYVVAKALTCHWYVPIVR